ncbi:MAG: RHS repeat protein [Acidobacteriota bacterium]|nr:RHS repeat protein [Acidobacteriota bacterium]
MRLLTATNPESGTTTYTYDNNGNLKTRTDANGTTMTVAGYDGLNRPYVSSGPAVTYSAAGPTVPTSPVTYTYDGDFKGALSS